MDPIAVYEITYRDEQFTEEIVRKPLFFCKFL